MDVRRTSDGRLTDVRRTSVHQTSIERPSDVRRTSPVCDKAAPFFPATKRESLLLLLLVALLLIAVDVTSVGVEDVTIFYIIN